MASPHGGCDNIDDGFDIVDCHPSGYEERQSCSMQQLLGHLGDGLMGGTMDGLMGGLMGGLMNDRLIQAYCGAFPVPIGTACSTAAVSSA